MIVRPIVNNHDVYTPVIRFDYVTNNINPIFLHIYGLDEGYVYNMFYLERKQG